VAAEDAPRERAGPAVQAQGGRVRRGAVRDRGQRGEATVEEGGVLALLATGGAERGDQRVGRGGALSGC
jgi:hypothetical protein